MISKKLSLVTAGAVLLALAAAGPVAARPAGR